MTSPAPSRSREAGFLSLLFFASGASALIFQSCWQRVLSLHAGMDLYSVTTVVSAFMAGLGVGSLAGGTLADRLSPVRAVAIYAAAELLIGLFGVLSLPLLYQRYGAMAPEISSTALAFGVHFALLSLPTFLMGMTLPLLARGVVRHSHQIAPRLGQLYGANTLGAAMGALSTSGSWLLGRIGLEGAVWLASSLNLLCGLGALWLWRLARELSAEVGANQEAAAPAAPQAEKAPLLGRPGHWVFLYGFTGFLSLGLEVLWFRLLNVLMSSNTFTFSRLLVGYLVGLGAGSFVGARVLGKVKRPDLAFLGLQAGIGAAALIGPLLVFAYLSTIGIRFGMRNFAAPLAILLPPTFMMGLCFPLIQRVVSERVETVGRRTGLLMFSNTAGCVAGTLVTGFVLLDRAGTPFTLSLYAALLVAPGLLALLSTTRGARRLALGAGALAAAAGLLLALPGQASFWKLLHGTMGMGGQFDEDGSCMIGMVEEQPGQHTLYISGEYQNGVPFDDFHLRLGTLPALIHPAPRSALVIGLGTGSTAYGVSLDPRVEKGLCIEICGGELRLLKGLRDRLPELDYLFSEPRMDFAVRDGRRHLLEREDTYDLVVTDTLLSRSAYSGSLYSREFYGLVRRRLREGGAFAQWVASQRSLETVADVFPHVVVVDSKGYEGPRFLVASDRPIRLDPAELLARLEAADRRTLRPGQLESLRAFTSAISGVPVTRTLAADELNSDLFPRDEYATTW